MTEKELIRALAAAYAVTLEDLPTTLKERARQILQRKKGTWLFDEIEQNVRQILTDIQASNFSTEK